MTPVEPAHIEVICGPMFSCKTETLIRRLRSAEIEGQRVQAFKPALDRRYHETRITSHSAQSIDAVAVDGVSKLESLVRDDTQVVGIDEAQFFGSFIVTVAKRLSGRGVRVIVAGLDMDYLGNPFDPMPQLLAVAERITKLTAVCARCGGEATRSYRIAGGHELVQVGSADAYEARCRRCAREGRAK